MISLSHPRKKLFKTKYIAFDARKCRACWKCLEVCPNDVFAKIVFLSHRHIRIQNPQNCTGCLRCKKVCSPGAIS
jgi:NAD-dependent dihydropyrimidine dehydrogenase PreA subunit